MSSASSSAGTSTTLDPVTFEVLRQSFVTLVDEMGARLARAAYSPVITQGRDYSLAMFDVNGDLVAAGRWDLPVHFGTFDFTIRETLRVIGKENIFEGDVYLFNDPYSGGTHNPDVRAIRPVFLDGRLFAWLVAMGHWPDVGGPVPGSFNPEAADCYSEGLRITPVKIYERGLRLDPVIDFIFANMREPDQRNGDLQAQIQSLYSGEERLLALAEKYGADTLELAFEACWDYAEKMLRSYTDQLPEGEYHWTDWVDEDPAHPDKPPVKIDVVLRVEAGRLVFDFSGSDPAPVGAVGSVLPSTWSGVLTSVLNLFPGVPMNKGVHRVVELVTIPGSAVHILPPTPCSGMASGAFEKINQVVIGAIGLADPARRAACNFNLINLTFGGVDQRFGRPYVAYLWNAGGWGATALGDVTLPAHMLFGPGARNQPVEVSERFYPIICESIELRQDSAGAGKHRGGWGIEYRFRLVDGEATLAVMGDREKYPIWGVDGGEPGAAQHLIIEAPDGSTRSIGMFASTVKIGGDDVIAMLSGGGGGFGDPLERPSELVLADVQEELLSVAAAKDQYGVVVAVDESHPAGYTIDRAATDDERDRRQRASA